MGTLIDIKNINTDLDVLKDFLNEIYDNKIQYIRLFYNKKNKEITLHVKTCTHLVVNSYKLKDIYISHQNSMIIKGVEFIGDSYTIALCMLYVSLIDLI